MTTDTVQHPIAETRSALQGRVNLRVRTIATSALAVALMAPAAAVAVAAPAHALDPFPRDYATWHYVDTTSGSAWKLTSDQAGDIWYADDNTEELVRIAPGVAGSTAFPLGLTDTRTVSMAATPDGHIWLGDAGPADNVMRRLDPTTGIVDTFPLAGRFPSAPEDIAVDEVGNIWFGGWNGASDPGLTMIRPDGSSSTVASPSGHMIEQIAVARDGRVWFTQDASSEFTVYDPFAKTYTTVSLGAVAPTGIWGAIDVQVSKSGDIWAATSTGVAKIAPDGTLLIVKAYPTRALPVTPRSMVAGEHAEMYMTDGEGGLARFDSAGNTTFYAAPFSAHDSWSVAVDRFGGMWTTLDGAHLGWV
ncbi:hypothetical protein [Herbiconiux sp.]|uniref:Vgb family protein n=1 Tax=Herbiconiux sp. TaxID=1871186 RepID=UPI0025C4F4D4|nr:hypothetical protein [Herbiconiux sp.]